MLNIIQEESTGADILNALWGNTPASLRLPFSNKTAEFRATHTTHTHSLQSYDNRTTNVTRHRHSQWVEVATAHCQFLQVPPEFTQSVEFQSRSTIDCSNENGRRDLQASWSPTEVSFAVLVVSLGRNSCSVYCGEPASRRKDCQLRSLYSEILRLTVANEAPAADIWVNIRTRHLAVTMVTVLRTCTVLKTISPSRDSSSNLPIKSDIPGAATLILSASTHRAGVGTTVKAERGEHVTTGNRTRVVRLAVTNANHYTKSVMVSVGDRQADNSGSIPGCDMLAPFGFYSGSHTGNRTRALASDIPGAATLILSASTHRAGVGTTVKTERGEHVTTGNRTRVVRLAVTNANHYTKRSHDHLAWSVSGG
ncbi:hypothetical protein Bbelb_410680 [Branchiostoma belcheri]|nr:hypothetical protein Bbelb_410680 [Branchiostoma belcheri]